MRWWLIPVLPFDSCWCALDDLAETFLLVQTALLFLLLFSVWFCLILTFYSKFEYLFIYVYFLNETSCWILVYILTRTFCVEAFCHLPNIFPPILSCKKCIYLLMVVAYWVWANKICHKVWSYSNLGCPERQLTRDRHCSVAKHQLCVDSQSTQGECRKS